jgi:hypothetical protein
MKISLRITLLFTLLLFFISNAKGVVMFKGNLTHKSVVSSEYSLKDKVKKFIKNNVLKKLKVQTKSIKKQWKNLKNNNEEFGKTGIISLFVLIATTTFIVLKLLGIITWSWFWVLSPLIFYIGLILLVIAIGIIVFSVLKKSND